MRQWMQLSLIHISLFEDVNPDVADVLFVPGGMPGTNNLKAHMGLRAAVAVSYTHLLHGDQGAEMGEL